MPWKPTEKYQGLERVIGRVIVDVFASGIIILPLLAVLVLFQLPSFYAFIGYCVFAITTVSVVNGDNQFFRRKYFHEFALDFALWPAFLVIALNKILKEDFV